MIIKKDKFGIKADVYRKTGKTQSNIFTFFLNRDLKCLKVYKKANYYYNKKSKIRFILYNLKLKHLCNKYDFNVPAKTQIGYGLFIGYNGSIIINPGAKIGNNNIATGVTIGQENRGKRKGCPTIGNKVWIGANAILVGKIKIGDNVLIAPNSFVNFDVPSNSIVIGNPGKIITSFTATEDYINRIVE